MILHILIITLFPPNPILPFPTSLSPRVAIVLFLYLRVCFFVYLSSLLYFCYSTYMSYHTTFVCFLFMHYFSSLMPSKWIHVLTNSKTIFIYTKSFTYEPSNSEFSKMWMCCSHVELLKLVLMTGVHYVRKSSTNGCAFVYSTVQ